jgi:hypothetical protein
VLTDTAAAGACLAGFAGDDVSTARPAGRVTNSDGTLVGSTIVPNGRLGGIASPIGGVFRAR